jgi:dihydroxyacetone kinase
MTALDMNGLSLSLVCLGKDDNLSHCLPIYLSISLPFYAIFYYIYINITCCLGNDDKMTVLLDSDTTAPAWSNSSTIDLSDITIESRSIPYNADSYAKKKIIGGIECSKSPLYTRNICDKIISIEQELTEFDQICGDGDCGIVMKAGAEGILKLISNDSENLSKDSAYFCDQIATCIGASMGGTSGVLLEIFFRSMACNFASEGQNYSISTMNSWKNAMSDGLESIKTYGGASVGMRTMLDSLEPAINNLYDSDNNVTKGLQRAVESANKGVESTKTMTSLAGRSNYISQDLMNGVPDPGAFAIAAAFSSVLDSLSKE